MVEVYFDHEKIKVYQLASDFYKYAHQICSKLDSRSDISNQSDRSSNSIVLIMLKVRESIPQKIGADILILQLVLHLNMLIVWISFQLEIY